MQHSSAERVGVDLSIGPLVSIVVPVFNGGDYLKRAIRSALSQSYRQVEVIVVDDGSSDGGHTAEVAKHFGTRVRYFYKPNGGVASALNHGIAQMRGEYFSWLSHDDMYKPDKVRRQVQLILARGSPNSIVFGGYHLINEHDRVTRTISPHLLMPARLLEVPLAALLNGLVNGCTLLIPRQLFLSRGTFNEKLLTTQDYDLWFRFMRDYSILYDEDVQVMTRQHAGQTSRAMPDLHCREGNALWSGFLDQLTDAEMSAIGGTPTAFLRSSAKMLSSTPYTGAAEHAERLAEHAAERIKVSVVVPFKNRVDWTVQCIRSVQAQTHRHWELVLVDNGTTDDRSSIDAICKADPRVRLLTHAKGGAAAARNLGIEAATGEYIAFLDSDDLFLPHKLSTQVRVMEGGNHGLTFTSYLRMSRHGKFLENMSASLDSGAIRTKDLIRCCPIATPTVMVRRSVLGSCRFRDLWPGEDVCMWLDLSTFSEWVRIDTPLSAVRMHGNNAGLDPALLATVLRNIVHHCEGSSHFAPYAAAIAQLREAALTQAGRPMPRNRPHTVANLPWRIRRESRRIWSQVAGLFRVR